MPALAAFMFLLVSRPVRDSLVVAFGNLVAARYDPQAAKRAFPRLAATGQVGAIAAGLTLPLLLRLGGARAAVVAWPLLALAALAVGRRLPTVLADGGMTAQGTTRADDRPATTFQRSPLLWSLAVAAMLAVATAAAFGLAAAQTLSRAIPDAAQLASVYSIIGALSSMSVLAVQVLWLPVLLRRVGTARAAAIPPAIAMVAAGSVVAVGGLATGIAAQTSRLTLRPALQTPMEDILLGLLPVGERAAGRAWLRGGAVPVAGLASSLLLAALAALGAGPRIVAGVAFLTASAGLSVALIVRRQHRRAALSLARDGDLRVGRVALPAFGGVDASVTDEIARRLATSTDDDERLMLVALLADLDPAAATHAVASLMPNAGPTLAIAMLAALAERHAPTTALLPHAPQLLASPLPAIRRATLAALGPALTADVTPFLDDPDPETALIAASLLIGRDPSHREARMRLLAPARSNSEDMRAAAAPYVSQLDTGVLVLLLSDPATVVRRAAAMAAGDLTAPSPDLAAALLAAAGDGATAVRVGAISALARLGDAGIAVLVVALDDPSPAVRAAAIATLLSGGAACAESLTRHLSPAHGWGRAASLAILAHWTPWRWRAMLLAEEGVALTFVAQLAAARPGRIAPAARSGR